MRSTVYGLACLLVTLASARAEALDGAGAVYRSGRLELAFTFTAPAVGCKDIDQVAARATARLSNAEANQLGHSPDLWLPKLEPTLREQGRIAAPCLS